MTTTDRAAVEGLLTALEQAYRRKSWHGATFRGALSRVDAEMAAWRPAEGRPNIWEIAVHAAYWKHNVWRRVSRDEVPRFPLAGSDWFPRPESGVDAEAWKRDLEILKRMHEGLLGAVSELTDSDLGTIPSGGKTTVENLVRGVAFHDVHHGGQVQLLKRLYAAESP